MRFLAHALVVALVSAAACGGDGAEPGEGDQPADTTAAAVPGGTADSPAAGQAASVSGQAVFSANCATCHGASGLGDGPAAVGLEPPPADLTDGVWVTGDGSLAALVNVIENGSPGTAMIGWKGTLSDAEINAVARHVQSLGQ